MNLKFFNFIVCKTSFKMETLKSIIAVMHLHQCMASVDVTDSYFHIRAVPSHHQCIRFSWLGQSYQFRALSFGLSLSPRVFTDTLAPLVAWLRHMGVQLYLYLDDILILGDSPHKVEESVQKTIQVLTQVRFIVNLKKSVLTPTQDLVYIGARFWTDLGKLYLPEEWIDGLLALVRSFSRIRQYKPALLFLSLLGPIATTLQSVEYAHLHMHPIQWYLKCRWNHITHGLCYMILVTKDLTQALQWWLVREHLSQGMDFSLHSTNITITTDASMYGWGCH